MKNRRNYYRILHVEPDAPTAVIRASYRAILARLKVHPDLGGDHAQAVLVNEAFATLGDPVRRAAYDRTISQPTQMRGRMAQAHAAASSNARQKPEPPKGKLGCGFCGAPYVVGDADRPESTCSACGSPLFAARRQSARAGTVGGEAPDRAAPAGNGRSRRALERAPRSMRLTFRLPASRHVAWFGTTEDISPNGMRFVAQAELQIGDRLQIECDFCRAVAVVKTSQPAPAAGRGYSYYGVEFLTLRLARQRGGFVSSVA